MSSKLQATLLIVIAVGVVLDAAYSKWIVAGAIALLALTMLGGTIKADRVTITGKLILEDGRMGRAILLCDPPGQIGRTSLLLTGSSSVLTKVMQRAASDKAPPHAPVAMLDVDDRGAACAVLRGQDPVVTIALEPDDWRGLVVRDQQGRTRLLVGVDAAGKPQIAFRDEQGNERVLAPSGSA